MRKFLLFVSLIQLSYLLSAQPAGYYNTAAGKSCSALKSALKYIVTNGHNPKPYDSLYNQYRVTDIKPRETGSGSANVIWDIYSDNPYGTDAYNFDPDNNKCGNYSKEGDCYNREHSVPQSWFNSASTPGSDYIQIFPTDGYVNGRRGNYIYGEVASASWTSKNGSKVGTSAIAGINETVFEPIDEYKGDVARAFFYFITRYQDNIAGWSGNTTAFSNDTFPSVNINYLKMMLQWNAADQVSNKEVDRNNAAYTYQGNRNPFIDHPEYVDMVWNSTCPGLSALPVDLIFFHGMLAGNNVQLQWQSSHEVNFLHYEVQKSTDGLNFNTIAVVSANNSNKYAYTDNISNFAGSKLYYRIKKTDKDGKFSYSEDFIIRIPSKLQLIVTPNPAQYFVQVVIPQSTQNTVYIQITDLTGRTVINTQVAANTGSVKIITQNLVSGTYFLKARAGDNQYMQKIIIAH